MFDFSTRLLQTLIYCVLSAILLIGCTATMQDTGASLSGSPKTKALRVGVSANAPPLAYKTGGKLQGLEIDLATQLGTYLGRDIRFVEMRWDKQIAALEEGKIDIIMSGMTITPKRAYRVAFSNPYMRSGQMLLVRMDQAGRFSSGIYSLMGSKPAIGTIKNTTGDFFITKTIHGANITRFSKSEQAVKALIDNKIDVLVHDAPVVCHLAALNEQNKLTPILQMATDELLAWPVNKMNGELLDQLNGFLVTKSRDGGLESTIKRWVPYLQ